MGKGYFLEWSPDGRKVVFKAKERENTNLYIVNSDGNGLKRLTKNFSYISQYCWLPDGEKIVFTAEVGKKFSEDIYIINVNGTGLKRLTHNGNIESIACSTY